MFRETFVRRILIRSCPRTQDNDVSNRHIYKNLNTTVGSRVGPRSRRMTLVDLPDYHRRVARARACRQHSRHFLGVNHVLAGNAASRPGPLRVPLPRGTMEINITAGNAARPRSFHHDYTRSSVRLLLLRYIIRIGGNVEIYLGEKKFVRTVLMNESLLHGS